MSLGGSGAGSLPPESTILARVTAALSEFIGSCWHQYCIVTKCVIIFLPGCFSLTSVQSTFIMQAEIFIRRLHLCHKWQCFDTEAVCKEICCARASFWSFSQETGWMKRLHLWKQDTKTNLKLTVNSISAPDLRLSTSSLSIRNFLVRVPLTEDLVTCIHGEPPSPQTKPKGHKR